MPRYHNINGNQVQFTAAEETARDNEEAAWAAGAFDRAIADVRTKRDRLIAQTDYLALSDNTLTDAMTTYRQALRDITNGITTVEQANAITWPTKPE
jgi:hypothetical protein